MPVSPASGTGGSRMILIGQYDSPFVRRVAIALTPYGARFENLPLFGTISQKFIPPVGPAAAA
jgi:hypothetical protein